MCEECVRIYNEEVNHTKLAKLDDLIPELMALGDKLVCMLPNSLTEVKVVLDNGEIVDVKDAPEETQKLIAERQDGYNRVSALIYATSFLAHRYTQDMPTEVYFQQLIPSVSYEGAKLGHVVRESLAMRRN